jgi:hypothetical protein
MAGSPHGIGSRCLGGWGSRCSPDRINQTAKMRILEMSLLQGGKDFPCLTVSSQEVQTGSLPEQGLLGGITVVSSQKRTA